MRAIEIAIEALQAERCRYSCNALRVGGNEAGIPCEERDGLIEDYENFMRRPVLPPWWGSDTSAKAERIAALQSFLEHESAE